MIGYLEIAATIAGLIQGVLIMYNKRSNWVAYVGQMGLLVAFSLANNLYGDVVNNTFYFFLGIAGFIMWKKDEHIKPTFCKANERIIYVAITIVGTVVLSAVLGRTDDPLPVLDSFTTVSSVVATYYMITKKIDTWLIWFVNDIFYAIEYIMLPDQAIYLFLLNVIWTFLAVGSYFNWVKIMKKNEDVKLYCAAPFCFDFRNDNYIEAAKKDYRAIILGNEQLMLQKHDYVKLNSRVDYIGPFYFETTGMQDKTIVGTELDMIRNCTHTVFLLDDACCPGTIAELSLATFLKKNVDIFYIHRKDDEETESVLHSPCWFPICMSIIKNTKTRVISCEDYQDAVGKINEYVKKMDVSLV